MKTIFALLAVFALVSLTGCTMFQDDIYKAQAGYYLSDGYDAVDAAIYNEFADRFGEGAVKRADVEWKYNHWTALSEQRAIGLDKYRVHVSAYPQIDGDGMYEPVVIVRKEAYTGSSYGFGRGGPTAMYSNKWREIGRDVHLEAELANAIYARLNNSQPSGEGGGR